MSIPFIDDADMVHLPSSALHIDPVIDLYCYKRSGPLAR